MSRFLTDGESSSIDPMFGRKFLSELLAKRSYAATLPNGKKETHDQNVDRVVAMHVKRFPKLEDQINEAFNEVRRRRVLPSMRTMQFSGRAIERSNARAYNCVGIAVENFHDFADIFWLSMNGCGVGFSVQRHHVGRLPIIEAGDAAELFVIADTKEAWADSVVALLKNPKCRFDYSQIRDEGTPLSTGGTASGPKPLRDAHQKIRKILQGAVGRRLRPIEVHDIVCHQSDAVVVGGVRRAALISLFNHDDAEMLSAKTDDWRKTNLQRERANNSAVILRGEGDTENLMGVIDACFSSYDAEPGFFMTNDLEYGTNPCQPADAPLLTPDGVRTMGQIQIGDTIWSGLRWTKVVRKICTGVKPVFEYKTDAGAVLCTEQHRVVENGRKVEARMARGIDVCPLPGHDMPAQRTQQIISTTLRGEETVWDITVDADEHTYWTGGLLVSNCGEISLRNKQACNLSEVNVAACRTAEDLYAAVKAATFIGTLQASLTDFPYIQPMWKKNCDEEALLGVSLTGQAENWPLLSSAYTLRQAAKVALDENERVARLIGINVAARIGTTKPSGSASIYLGTTSGIHPAFDRIYVRRMQIEKSSPLAQHLMEVYGVGEPGEGRPIEQHCTKAGSIQVAAPIVAPQAILAPHESAIDLMNRALHIKKNWIEPSHRSGPNTHNVSMTVYYDPKTEQEPIKAWLREHHGNLSGIAFMPRDGGNYKATQMPLESIPQEEFNRRLHEIKSKKVSLDDIDFSKATDERLGEVACAGGACEIL